LGLIFASVIQNPIDIAMDMLGVHWCPNRTVFFGKENVDYLSGHPIQITPGPPKYNKARAASKLSRS
jgi:hypothetical protein